MNNWHILYNTVTGQSVSIGTVIADPLPTGITALPLTDEQGEGLQNGSLKWDAASRTLIPTPLPAVTAEEWVSQQKFDGNRPTTLLYLKLQLDAAQKSSPKLAAVQGWLDGMIIAGVTSPDEERSDYPAAPFSFEAASQEALAVLAG
jgi:hypothetical protein